MDIYILCVLVLAWIVYAVFIVWKGADDRDWEAHWAALDELDRAWIAAASRSRASRAALSERGELALAKGFSRRETRWRASVLLATLAPFVAIAILILTGVIGDHFAPLLLGTFALLQSLIALYRDRQIKSRYRETQARYLAAPADTASTA